MWDDDAPTAPAESLCSDIKKVSEQMDAAGEIKKANSDAVRQCLNNAGAYLLFREKARNLSICNRENEEGGAILKYALQLSDRDGININENVYLDSRFLGRLRAATRWE